MAGGEAVIKARAAWLPAHDEKEEGRRLPDRAPSASLLPEHPQQETDVNDVRGHALLRQRHPRVPRAARAIGTAGVLALAAQLALAGGAGVIGAGDGSPDASEAPVLLALTPSQQEGPYYPVELPRDRDADLTRVDGVDGTASGETLLLEGVALTPDGAPVEGAVVEIWQTDHQGVYLHPQDPGIGHRDVAFQGYGESTTDASGAWSFRTILPEIYGGRPRHIHAKVRVDDQTVLTTQIYFSGGDIPEEGTVALSREATDRLSVEAVRGPGTDGQDVLHARHVIVIPVPSGS